MEPDYFFLTRHNFGIFVRAFKDAMHKDYTPLLQCLYCLKTK